MQANEGMGLGTQPGYCSTWMTGVTWHSSLAEVPPPAVATPAAPSHSNAPHSATAAALEGAGGPIECKACGIEWVIFLPSNYDSSN